MGQPVPPLPPTPPAPETVREAGPIPLPKDPSLLAQLKDQLEDFLMALERNTDAMNDWLARKKELIAVHHHQLVRAITQKKDMQEALTLLSAMGDHAGFVLSLQDFGAMANASFGKNSDFHKKAGKIKTGFPDAIFEPLPQIVTPDEKERVAKPVPPEGLTDKSMLNTISDWFTKEKREKEAAERERLAEEDIKRRWRETRNEIISLQSDRHYYVDSLMDWVAETLEPEINPDGTPRNIRSADLMEQYQSPAYVLELARKDYEQVAVHKTAAIRDMALRYAEIAGYVDRQNVSALIPALPELVGQKFPWIMNALLADFGVRSVSDLALTHITDRKDQYRLLNAASPFEPVLRLTGCQTSADAFEKILSSVLDPADPLPPDALYIAARKTEGISLVSCPPVLGLDKQGASVFERIAKRFRNDLPVQAKALHHLLSGISAPARDQVRAYEKLTETLENRDVTGLREVLLSTPPEQGSNLLALWQLCNPGAAILPQLINAAKDKRELGGVISAALSIGFLGDFRQEIIPFFEKNVLDAPHDFDRNTARRLLATAYANDGLDKLRDTLARSGGWLEKLVLQENMQDSRLLEWTALLLEPFGNDIARANILASAAARTTDKTAARTLRAMETSLVGNSVRLSQERLILNLDRTANIWYNPDTQALKYTCTGTAHTLAESLSPAMAREVLDLLQRRGNFLREQDGLFRPETTDRIVTNSGGTHVSWGNRTGTLNADATLVAELHRRTDFIHDHVQPAVVRRSFNPAAVLMILPQEDGKFLLVDKYGHAETLHGTPRIPDACGLLSLGGAWLNPANAALLSLSPETGSVEVRIESQAFEEFLDHIHGNEGYFHAIEGISDKEFETLKKALDALPGIVAPGGGFSHLRFNLRALGYLSYEDGRETGFECRRFGPVNRPGLIRMEEADALEVAEAARAGGALQVGGLIVDAAMVDNAYYNQDKGEFYVVVGHDLLMTPCPDGDAFAALKNLAAVGNFAVAATTLHKGKEHPADIVNVERATFLSYAAAKDKLDITCEHDRFHANLDRGHSIALMDELEKRHLPANAGWPMEIRSAFDNLPSLRIQMPIHARPGTAGKAELFEALCSPSLPASSRPSKPASQLRSAFGIAASPVREGESFDYPPARRPAAADRKGGIRFRID